TQLTAIMVALGPILPILRRLGLVAKQITGITEPKRVSPMRTAELLGSPIALALLWVVDVLAHQLMHIYPGWSWGIIIVVIAGAFSLALGRAFDFLNFSSLHAAYAVRITRTFQGASNENRIYGSPNDEARDVRLSHPEDDTFFDRYHPEDA